MHTPAMEGHFKFCRGGESQMVKFLKESINWNFQRVWEGVWRHNGLMGSVLV